MKKKYFLGFLLLALCVILVGCGSEDGKKEDPSSKDGWVLNMDERYIILDDIVKKSFDEANEDYSKLDLRLVALLGEQVVSGTNYMFLCITDNQYKVAVVYKNLDGKSEITRVEDFDLSKYYNKNVQLNVENLVGGWETNIPGKPIMLEEDVQEAFDTATEGIDEVTYFPIDILAKQEKSGINYAILCYGRLSDENGTEGVFVMTLNIDENKIPKVVSVAQIDLKDYNK